MLWPGTHQTLSYHKAALMLHTLERLHSWEVMQRVLSTFFARWKFKHPQPDDFFAVLNEVTGQDHAWFVEQVYRSSNTFDYAIERLASEHDRVARADGIAERPAFQETRRSTGCSAPRWWCGGSAAGQFPVDVLVTFSNGEQERETWDGRGALAGLHVRSAGDARCRRRSIRSACCCSTPTTPTTAGRSSPPTDRAATKWSLRWMVWLQDLLMTCAFLV